MAPTDAPLLKKSETVWTQLKPIDPGVVSHLCGWSIRLQMTDSAVRTAKR